MAAAQEDLQASILYKQAFYLSALSNAVGEEIGTAAELEQKLTDRVKAGIRVMSGWSVTYGPCVYKLSEAEWKGRQTGPDNAWFAATGPGSQNPVCVVAVAGTARHSIAALTGDVLVTWMMNFENWVKKWTSQNIPRILPAIVAGPDDQEKYTSQGTAIAVHDVLSNRGSKYPQTELLHQYLATLPKNCTVIFTGHSLGATIAPTVALGLVKMQDSLKTKVKEILVQLTGGPSAGVGTFSKDFEATFPPKDGFNSMLYNQWDLMPQAWSLTLPDQNPDNIFSKIYDTATDAAKAEIKDKVEKAKRLLHSRHPPYVPIRGTRFTPKRKPDKNTNDKDAPDSYRKESMWQHAEAYGLELGVSLPKILGEEEESPGIGMPIMNSPFEELDKVDFDADQTAN